MAEPFSLASLAASAPLLSSIAEFLRERSNNADREKVATLQGYIEWLRRRDHSEISQSLSRLETMLSNGSDAAETAFQHLLSDVQQLAGELGPSLEAIATHQQKALDQGIRLEFLHQMGRPLSSLSLRIAFHQDRMIAEPIGHFRAILELQSQPYGLPTWYLGGRDDYFESKPTGEMLVGQRVYFWVTEPNNTPSIIKPGMYTNGRKPAINFSLSWPNPVGNATPERLDNLQPSLWATPNLAERISHMSLSANDFVIWERKLPAFVPTGGGREIHLPEALSAEEKAVPWVICYDLHRIDFSRTGRRADLNFAANWPG
ncbi:MAG TPA: hypothetical protein VIM11_15490 [Tepidisphaeraceae bacterium]|jgi:hypothetical protein